MKKESDDDNSDKDEEIKELKRRIEALEKKREKEKESEREKEKNSDMVYEDNEKSSETHEKKKSKKGLVASLVILIIIILVIDIACYIVIFKPDFSFNFGNSGSGDGIVSGDKCSDGTAYNSCSKNKPFFCYKGELVKKAAECGCPSGYVKDFQDCVRP